MELTCFNCQKTFKVPPIPIAAAKLKFALGFDEASFPCPKCQKLNEVTKAEFEAAVDGRAGASSPAGGAFAGKGGGAGAPKPGFGTVTGRGSGKPTFGPGPALAGNGREGVVIVRSLHVRKDHSTKSETMAGLKKGDKVKVLGTWTDGENTWANLGPDRWAAIIYEDKPMIEFPN
jgi:hypothetical protein